jgi:hypothetical protein
VTLNGVETWLKPTSDWQAKDLNSEKTSLTVDKNFYVIESNITN